MTRPSSAALLGVGHLAVSWNEEMVFRGYGFETVRQALGQGKALQVTGDTKYGTIENIKAIEDAFLRAYIPLRTFEDSRGVFGKQRFKYEEQEDSIAVRKARCCGYGRTTIQTG